MYLARIYITLKPTVNDPQGWTVLGSLHNLGFAAVTDVRVEAAAGCRFWRPVVAGGGWKGCIFHGLACGHMIVAKDRLLHADAIDII